MNLHNQQLTATADRTGEWTASLMPEAAGGPYTLTVRGFDAQTTTKDGAAEIKAADHPQVRLLHVNHASSDYPLEDVKDTWTTYHPRLRRSFQP